MYEQRLEWIHTRFVKVRTNVFLLLFYKSSPMRQRRPDQDNTV